MTKRILGRLTVRGTLEAFVGIFRDLRARRLEVSEQIIFPPGGVVIAAEGSYLGDGTPSQQVLLPSFAGSAPREIVIRSVKVFPPNVGSIRRWEKSLSFASTIKEDTVATPTWASVLTNAEVNGNAAGFTVGGSANEAGEPYEFFAIR